MGDLASSPTLQTLSETYNVYIFTHTQTRTVPSLVPRPSLSPVVELPLPGCKADIVTRLSFYCHVYQTESLGMRQRV